MNIQLRELMEKLCNYLKENGHNYCTPEMVYHQLHICYPRFSEICKNECKLYTWIMLCAGVGKSYEEIYEDIQELLMTME